LKGKVDGCAPPPPPPELFFSFAVVRRSEGRRFGVGDGGGDSASVIGKSISSSSVMDMRRSYARAASDDRGCRVVAFAVVLIFLMEQSFENELLLMNVVLHAHVLAYLFLQHAAPLFYLLASLFPNEFEEVHDGSVNATDVAALLNLQKSNKNQRKI
jgi:hypothetical protein